MFSTDEYKIVFFLYFDIILPSVGQDTSRPPLEQNVRNAQDVGRT